jgi:hypothetical protein
LALEEAAEWLLRPHTDVSARKMLQMHESPVRRAAPQHPEVDVNGSNGPILLKNSTVFEQVPF